MDNPINYWYQKYLEEKEKNEGMIEALHTEYEKGRADILKNSIVCRAGWCDGFFLDYSQEQQDTLLEKIGVDVGDKVRVILMKE